MYSGTKVMTYSVGYNGQFIFLTSKHLEQNTTPKTKTTLYNAVPHKNKNITKLDPSKIDAKNV